MHACYYNLFHSNCIILSVEENIEHVTKGSFEIYPYIPDSLTGQSELLKEMRRSADLFNLPVLYQGIRDSLEIRIWPWEAFEWFKNVFIFKHNDNNWRGYHYFSYTMPIIDQDGKLMTFGDIRKIGDSVFLVKEITPACGWQNFSDSLEYFKIRTLPTQAQIKNFEHKPIMDGDAVSLEIATRKSYRRIGYGNPSSYQYEECKLIEAFMEMLKRQFGKDYFWPRE